MIDKDNNNNNSNIYISYSLRVFISMLICFVFLLLTVLFSFKAFNFNESEIINYQENSDLDYKVYLKDNDFYDNDYLEKNMLYVASLIDNIVVDFNYFFNIDKNVNINFNYDIVAKLSINNLNDNKKYFEKEYVLKDTKNVQILENNNYKLFEQVKIDYDYYNLLANNFKKSYGLNAESKLQINLRIKKDSLDENEILNDQSLMSLVIPLSEKSVDIKMDYNEIDNFSYMISNKHVFLDNILYCIITVICLIILILFGVKFIKLISLIRNKKSNYDKYISKIMNEYDRLIVEILTSPNFEKNNVIKVYKFEELLDVRDNLKLPILYYNVVKHHKCYFYVKHNRDIYLLTIKSINFDNVYDKNG